jgi:hypothetical protein
MVLFLGMFLLNALCAIVPCQKLYDPPVPVPKAGTNSQSFQSIRVPILETNQKLLVKTRSGFIQGFPMKTIRARDIVAFTGVPYAEPPIMDLRYRVRQSKFTNDTLSLKLD